MGGSAMELIESASFDWLKCEILGSLLLDFHYIKFYYVMLSTRLRPSLVIWWLKAHIYALQGPKKKNPKVLQYSFLRRYTIALTTTIGEGLPLGFYSTGGGKIESVFEFLCLPQYKIDAFSRSLRN